MEEEGGFYCRVVVSSYFLVNKMSPFSGEKEAGSATRVLFVSYITWFVNNVHGGTGSPLSKAISICCCMLCLAFLCI